MNSGRLIPVIGLELHIRLNTSSKLFCSCPNRYDGEANSFICPVCMGLPGSLPVLNREALKKALVLAISLNAEIQLYSQFTRKNYFYPDLPKGYQITQYHFPLAKGGKIKFKLNKKEKEVRFRRIHLEEDAGKLSHRNQLTLIDYNRCGAPLVEVVTEPDLQSADEAYYLLKTLKRNMQYLNISDCEMEKGSLRCDANISIKSSPDAEKSNIVEIKNLNSFKGVRKALQFEMERQIRAIERGLIPKAETRSWDPVGRETFPIRLKEEQPEYMYLPEPDLPPIKIAQELLDSLKSEIPEMPQNIEKKFVELYGLSESTANQLVTSRAIAELFMKCVSKGCEPQLLSKYLIREIFHYFGKSMEKIPMYLIDSESFSKFILTIQQKRITEYEAKEILQMAFSENMPLGKCMSIVCKSNASIRPNLDEIIPGIIEENPSLVRRYKEGKKELFNYFIGVVMRRTKGKFDPGIIRKKLRDFLDENS